MSSLVMELNINDTVSQSSAKGFPGKIVILVMI